MEILTYTDARANLKSVIDRVIEDCTEVVVTRQKSESVVVVAKAEWDSMKETIYLLSSRRNADRLHAGIKQLDSGEAVERELQTA